MLSWWFWTVSLKPREFLHPAPNKKREAHPQVAEVAAPWEADQASIHLTLWDLLRPSRRTLGQKWVALRCSRSSWPQKNVRYQHVFEGWFFWGKFSHCFWMILMNGAEKTSMAPHGEPFGFLDLVHDICCALGLAVCQPVHWTICPLRMIWHTNACSQEKMRWNNWTTKLYSDTPPKKVKGKVPLTWWKMTSNNCSMFLFELL